MIAKIAVIAAVAACGDNRAPDRVLVYSRVTGYRHADAIALGTQVLTARLAADDITAEASEDPAAFADLSRYRGVIFFYTDGNDVLDPAGKAALEQFVRAGGGWLGVHSAASTELEWPFMGELLVARFASHPAIQPATVDVVDRGVPFTAALPAGRWMATDEWYNFDRNPRGDGVHVGATIDETTYQGGTMGADHPMVWWHERLGGRVAYSQFGHVAERWNEPAFVELVAGEVRWIIRRDP